MAKTETIVDERIDVINRKYQDQDITFEQADQLMVEIRDQLWEMFSDTQSASLFSVVFTVF